MVEKDAGTEEQPQPTPEEQMASLRAELKAEQETRAKAESRAQGLEGSLKEKDRIIKGQVDTTSRLDTLEDMIKILAITKGVQDDELRVDETQRPDINKAFADISKKREEQTRLSEEKRTRDEYNQRANAIYAQGKEKFKDDEESLDRLEFFLERGKLERAEALLAKEVKVEKPDLEKEKKEKEKEKLAEEGELKSEMGSPAGAVDRFTLEKAANYSTKGKSKKEIQADAEKLLDQLTK